MTQLKYHVAILLAGLLVASRFSFAADGATTRPFMPAFADGATILFQGDSITDGNRGRTTDPNHILGHGYQFIISARFGADLAERHLAFINRGVSGNKVSDLQRRWQKDTIGLNPDLLSILIGVNDLGSGVTAELFEQQYDQLLADTVAALPHVKLVLCEPFGLPVGKKKDIWDTYRPELESRQAAVARLAEKHHAAIVHFQKIFDDATSRGPPTTGSGTESIPPTAATN